MIIVDAIEETKERDVVIAATLVAKDPVLYQEGENDIELEELKKQINKEELHNN